MREETLELLCCPDCGHAPLELRDAALLEGEIESGRLLCASCEGAFPIVLGIARLLPTEQLPPLLDDFSLLDRYPKALRTSIQGLDSFSDSVRRTMLGYTLEHLWMEDPEPDWDANWRYFDEHSLVPRDEYAGRRVLDLGCGDGRFVGCAAELADLTIGMDLSRGVELARRRTRHRGEVDFVQADVFHLPFRPGVFDIISSIGVLHHTPDPRGAYLSVAKALAPAGRLNIWVYGLDGMSLEYRLSHMVPLRERIKDLDLDERLQLSFLVCGLLDLGLWGPARLMERLHVPVLPSIVRRLPVVGTYGLPFRTRLRAVFDRIQPPEASYHTREELSEWTVAAGLQQLELRTKGGRGWLSLAGRA